MGDQGLITPEMKDQALENVANDEESIDKKMEQKRQKQLTKLRNKMNDKRRKVLSIFRLDYVNLFSI